MKRRYVSLGACVSLFALAMFAGRIPFSENPDAEFGAPPVSMFSPEYFRNFLPLAAILALSVAGIILLAVIRRGLRGTKTAPKFGSRAVPSQKKLGFSALRWTIMIFSAFCMIFGGTVLGLRFANVSLPVFACPINTTQLTETSCYFLSHLPELFEEFSPVGVVTFFATTIGSALLLGRVICGFLCPMGLVQDAVYTARLNLRGGGVTMTEKTYEAFKPVKWTMVFLMLGLCFVGGNFCDFCPVATLSPILAGVRVSLYFSGFAMIIVLVAGYFKRRAFCLICPLGVLLGLCHKVSPFRIRKDCQACTECGVCYEACPMGIKGIYTQRGKADVTESACIFCGECVRKCPEDNALSMTFCGHPFYTASRKQALSGYEKIAKRMDRKGDET